MIEGSHFGDGCFRRLFIEDAWRGHLLFSEGFLRKKTVHNQRDPCQVVICQRNGQIASLCCLRFCSVELINNTNFTKARTEGNAT